MPQLSYWESTTYYKKYDVAIIGSGLMGLWTALELKQRQPNLSVIILEKDSIPTGASTRNAGFACFGSPTELLADTATMGEATMWQIVDLRYKGIEKIKQYFTADDIDFDACGGYELYHQPMHDIGYLAHAMEDLNKGMKAITGQSNAFYWANEKIQEFGFAGFDAMIGNAMEGGLHSGKLVQALTRKVLLAGVEIRSGITISATQKTTTGVLLMGNNVECHASTVLYCTNGFTTTYLPKTQIEPARGQVLVTAPIEGLAAKGTFHYDCGYYYFRNVGNRILLGGARNKSFDTECTTVLETNEVIQAALEDFLQQHILPHQPYTIDYRWAGLMGFTNNKLPQITTVDDHIFAATICNGMGVALSPIMAEQAAAILLQ
jgi:glycine/D-amino acid oxidase-like deaminating enzyme